MSTTNSIFKSNESGLLLVFMEPGCEVTLEEFHEWYDNEHVPLRIERFPTFRSAVRYCVKETTLFPNDNQGSQENDIVEMPPKSSWGAFYTVSTNTTFCDPAYTSLRSERSEREAELFTRLAIVDRRIYKLEYDSDEDVNNNNEIQMNGKKIGLAVQTAKETPRYLIANSVDMKSPELLQEYNKWFEQEHVVLLSKIPGWRRSRRFTLLDNGVNGTNAKKQDAKSVPSTLCLHEYDNDSPEETPEFKLACSTQWRTKVIGGEQNQNILRRERKVCSIYRAWDPIAAIRSQNS
ncbi:uncharacterized protein MEPE_01489 [Melanopsichium pennsylvanicum]|uniref:EthD domain-containing protein n=1 Tax=Melanopsichium pennsylvanicum TaxID=63383 RepID=A0AAJ5C3Q8_9BASI|nr:uncharacterized protein MEPE_01489 [Melanopsichium pennsylvanicum]